MYKAQLGLGSDFAGVPEDEDPETVDEGERWALQRVPEEVRWAK